MYYLYKTTNLINHKYYIGVHYSEDIDNDDYLGSGKHLKSAIKKYGKDKFKRQILYQFESEEKAYLMQSQIVDKQFVHRFDIYNIKYGGEGGQRGRVIVKDKWGNVYQVDVDDPKYISKQLVFINSNMVTVKDKDGNTLNVSRDDSRYLSGQLKFIHYGKVKVKDKSGNIHSVDKHDPRYLSGQMIFIATGMVPVKDKDGNQFMVDQNDPRFLSGQLQYVHTGQVVVKDEFGKKFMVHKQDPRYLSGKLVNMFKGTVSVKDKNGKCFRVSKNDPRWLSGQLVGINRGIKFSYGHQLGQKNSQYGTIWVTNGKQNKKIKKDNNIPQGWRRGRKLK